MSSIQDSVPDPGGSHQKIGPIRIVRDSCGEPLPSQGLVSPPSPSQIQKFHVSTSCDQSTYSHYMRLPILIGHPYIRGNSFNLTPEKHAQRPHNKAMLPRIAIPNAGLRPTSGFGDTGQATGGYLWLAAMRTWLSREGGKATATKATATLKLNAKALILQSRLHTSIQHAIQLGLQQYTIQLRRSKRRHPSKCSHRRPQYSIGPRPLSTTSQRNCDCSPYRYGSWDWMATSLHAVLALVGIMIGSMIMVQNAAVGMPRLGIG